MSIECYITVILKNTVLKILAEIVEHFSTCSGITKVGFKLLWS